MGGQNGRTDEQAGERMRGWADGWIDGGRADDRGSRLFSRQQIVPYVSVAADCPRCGRLFPHRSFILVLRE